VWLSRQFPAPNGRSEFQKRSQLFIRTHNETLFVAGTMGKKAAWQQANPFHNISNDRGGACG
jgi:hypothetical protein